MWQLQEAEEVFRAGKRTCSCPEADSISQSVKIQPLECGAHGPSTTVDLPGRHGLRAVSGRWAFLFPLVVQLQEVCVRATSSAVARAESLLHLVTTQNNNGCHPLPELNNNGPTVHAPGRHRGQRSFYKVVLFSLSKGRTAQGDMWPPSGARVCVMVSASELSCVLEPPGFSSQ